MSCSFGSDDTETDREKSPSGKGCGALGTNVGPDTLARVLAFGMNPPNFISLSKQSATPAGRKMRERGGRPAAPSSRSVRVLLNEAIDLLLSALTVVAIALLHLADQLFRVAFDLIE